MRLATIRTAGGTRAVQLDGDRAVETGHVDVGALLAEPDWRAVAEAAEGPAHDRRPWTLRPWCRGRGRLSAWG